MQQVSERDVGGRRVPLLDVDEARARALDVGVPEGMAELNVFRILLHDPPTAAALNGLLHRLLWKGSLDQRRRRLLRRTAHRPVRLLRDRRQIRNQVS